MNMTIMTINKSKWTFPCLGLTIAVAVLFSTLTSGPAADRPRNHGFLVNHKTGKPVGYYESYTRPDGKLVAFVRDIGNRNRVMKVTPTGRTDKGFTIYKQTLFQWSPKTRKFEPVSTGRVTGNRRLPDGKRGLALFRQDYKKQDGKWTKGAQKWRGCRWVRKGTGTWSSGGYSERGRYGEKGWSRLTSSHSGGSATGTGGSGKNGTSGGSGKSNGSSKSGGSGNSRRPGSSSSKGDILGEGFGKTGS